MYVSYSGVENPKEFSILALNDPRTESIVLYNVKITIRIRKQRNKALHAKRPGSLCHHENDEILSCNLTFKGNVPPYVKR